MAGPGREQSSPRSQVNQKLATCVLREAGSSRTNSTHHKLNSISLGLNGADIYVSYTLASGVLTSCAPKQSDSPGRIAAEIHVL